MRVMIELDCDQENKLVVDSLKWMYGHGELTKKERKAYRKVLAHYMSVDEYQRWYENE